MKVAIVLVALLTGCSAGTAISGRNVELTPDAYGRSRESHAVVLMSVDWGRRWGFCAVENAQLMTFAFDRVPVQKRGDADAADVFLEGPPGLPAGAGAIGHYALLVEPGEYALSFSELEASPSINRVVTYRAGRSKLLSGGAPVAGSFKVGSGELVYVGHFALECVNEQPTIWRYYIEGREAFDRYLATSVKAKYPFLDTAKAQYRLFRTSVIGRDYELR